MIIFDTILLRRGVESARTGVVFQQGEPIYCTDSKLLYIGDGVTLGGVQVSGADLSNVYYPLHTNPSGYFTTGNNNCVTTGVDGVVTLNDPNRFTNTISGQTILNTYDSGNSTYLGIVIGAETGNNRSVRYCTASGGQLIKRWATAVDPSAELGGNAGSDFFISRSDDAGAGIDAPIFITRSNGFVQIGDRGGVANYQLDVNGVINTLSGFSFQGTGNSLLTATGTNLYLNGQAVNSYPHSPLTKTSNFSISGNTLTYPLINTYIVSGANTLTGTLPTNSQLGDVIKLIGITGGWKIAQNSGQKIFFGNTGTTIGAAGFLSSSNQFDVVQIECVNTNRYAVTTSIGNLNVN